MMGCFRTLSAWLVAIAMIAASLGPSVALAEDTRQAKRDAGIGLATVVANIFYVPAKVAYAALGGVTGGLAYALTVGNTEAAQKVWVASGGGDYVLSTDHIAGQRPIQFTGQPSPPTF